MILLTLAALLQQPAAPPVPARAQLPSRIARVTVEPIEPTLLPGDTLRLVAVAYDSAGRPLPDARITYFAAGGDSKGQSPPTGWSRPAPRGCSRSAWWPPSRARGRTPSASG